MCTLINTMSIVEELLRDEIQDVLGKLVYGLNRSLLECNSPTKDFMNLLLSFLFKGNVDKIDFDTRDTLLCELAKHLLHALKHCKEDEGESAFSLICRCISFCMKSSKNCCEILNSFIVRCMQRYVRVVKETDFTFGDDDEDELIGDCQLGNTIPVPSIFHLLLEICKDGSTSIDEKEKGNGFGILKPEIFDSLLQVMAVDADEAILAVLSQIIKIYLKQSEPERKEIFAKLYDMWWQELENNALYGVACLIIDMLLCGNEYDIRHEKTLRTFIQNGLTSDDILKRKRVMYILKKIVGADPINENSKEWSNLADFILLFEALEEKQLHLILPVLPIVSNVLDLSDCKHPRGNILHFSWVATIIIHALRHDNRFITRWAIDTMLDFEVKKFSFFHDKSWYCFIDPLFSALREYHLFEKEPGSDISTPPSIVAKLTGFLLQCQTAASANQQIEFFRKIIASLCSSGYNAVAFPYIAEAISSVKLPGVIDFKLLSLIKTWMLSDTSTFPTELKSASFHLLLKIIVNCLSKDEVTLAMFIQLLKVTFEQGCLKFGNELWCLVITAMRDNILCWRLQHSLEQTIENLESLKKICKLTVSKFLDGKCELFDSTTEIGLLILITIDLTKESGREAAEQFLEHMLEIIFGILIKFGRNPYISEDSIGLATSLLHFMLKSCVGATVNDQKPPVQCIAMSRLICEKLLARSKAIFAIHQYILENIFHEDSVGSDLTELCFDITSSICDHMRNASDGHLVFDHLTNILKVCSSYIKSVIENRNSRSIYLIFKSLEIVCKTLDGQLDEHRTHLSLNLERGLLEMVKELELDVTIYLPVRHSTRANGSEDTSFFAGNIMRTFWTLISFALKKEEIRKVVVEKARPKEEDRSGAPLSLMTCNISEMVHKIIEAIEISVGNDMVPLLRCLQCLMSDIMTSSKGLSIFVLESVWRLCKEQERRDSRFWLIFVPCVNILFHKSILLSDDDELIEKVTEFWRFLEDVGKKKSGVFNIVVSHCCAIWEIWLLSDKKIAKYERKSVLWCIDLFADACTFGLVQKKAAKIMQQIIRYFNAKFIGEREVSKNVNIDYEVRWTVTNMLSKIDENSEHSSIVIEVMKKLVEKDRKLSIQVRRYYDNSITHRQKLRIWQTMLALGKFVDEENAPEIIAQALSVMVSENQPSIRYYIEWFVVMVIRKMPSLIGVIWQNLSGASERRVCSVTCLMSIIMHVTVVLPDEEFSEMAAEAFTKLLPWVQIHHMQARVHAQIVIWKLWDELKRRHCDDILKEYRLIESLFSLNDANASVFKAREELRNHFFFKIFHPLEHYSLETIYCSMPKLLSIGEDEILSRNELVEVVKSGETRYDIEVCNKTESLYDLVSKMRHRCDVSENKLDERGSKVTDNSAGKEGFSTNTIDVQKKIVAWKPLPPTEDPFLQKADIYKKDLRKSELILCASLIDRTPNLGGLCRTCEIFGVSTLVIGAMRYLDDANFKSLSVTSEKWINIEQVLPRHLEVYLTEMKGKGYRLVGIEQTANSRSLEDYKFQEKTLLLLGNEREGIPVELIHTLDDCVEIPQLGVIRSLNVHVSGAIITWEYCKQRLLKQHKDT